MELDPASLTSTQRYRWLISLIVPRPIAWVSTRGRDGTHNLAPFSFFMGVSSEPPVLALALSRREGAPKDTARNILESGEFVVNAAGEDAAEAINLSSGDWAPDVDEFALADVATAPSHLVSPPRVATAAFALECRLHQAIPIGVEPRETLLVLGEIVWMHVRDDVLEDADDADQARLADPGRLRPLARLGRNLYTRLGPLLALDRPRGRHPGSSPRRQP